MNGLADLDELCCTRGGMGFEFAPFGPVIGVVVMTNIADEEAALALMYDQADVAADAHRCKVGILHAVKFVKAHARAGRVDLQIKDCGLDRFLLVVGEFGKAVYECVGNAKFHLSSDTGVCIKI